MTETLTRARPAKQDLRRHVLALVLFVVLVWYTVVSPSYFAAPPRPSDGDSPDAEERGAGARAGAGFAGPRTGRAFAPRPDKFGTSDEEELDWPEIIGGD